MNNVRIGLIGMGQWGRRFYTALLEAPQVTVPAVASTNPNTQDLVTDVTAVFVDWQQMIDEVALDAVVIATPPACHVQMAVQALSQGLAVLLEKPMATSSREADLIREAVISGGRPFMVGHVHLHSAAFQELKKCIGRAEPIREIVSVGGGWGPFRKSYRGLWDYGPHDIAMAITLMQELPKSVSAKLRTIGPRPLSEIVEIELEFDGSFAKLTVGNAMAEKRRYFAAETGTFKFEYDDLAVEKLICIDMDNNSVPVSVAIESPLSREIAAFRDLVNSNILSSTDLDLGIVITKVLEGTELSLKRSEAKIPFKSCLSN